MSNLPFVITSGLSPGLMPKCRNQALARVFTRLAWPGQLLVNHFNVGKFFRHAIMLLV